jgi:hypothetical protein
MSNLKTVTAVVRNILENYKQTRNCDGLLYLKVLEHYSLQKNIELRFLSVPVFLTQMDSMGFPGFETVRRARQKLQATYPQLSAAEAVQGFRAEQEVEYKSYALQREV